MFLSYSIKVVPDDPLSVVARYESESRSSNVGRRSLPTTAKLGALALYLGVRCHGKVEGGHGRDGLQERGETCAERADSSWNSLTVSAPPEYRLDAAHLIPSSSSDDTLQPSSRFVTKLGAAAPSARVAGIFRQNLCIAKGHHGALSARARILCHIGEDTPPVVVFWKPPPRDHSGV